MGLTTARKTFPLCGHILQVDHLPIERVGSQGLKVLGRRGRLTRDLLVNNLTYFSYWIVHGCNFCRHILVCFFLCFVQLENKASLPIYNWKKSHLIMIQMIELWEASRQAATTAWVAFLQRKKSLSRSQRWWRMMTRLPTSWLQCRKVFADHGRKLQGRSQVHKHLINAHISLIALPIYSSIAIFETSSWYHFYQKQCKSRKITEILDDC